MPAAGVTVDALYFDGHSARGTPVRLRLDGALLLAEGEALRLSWPVADVRWPERTRHGQRQVHLRDGGVLQALDAAAFDAWRGRGDEGWVVRSQQHWRASLLALVLLVLLGAAGYRFGVPLASRAALAVLPERIDAQVGDAVMAQLDGWLQPSKLPRKRREALRLHFGAVAAAAYPDGVPQHTLYFRAAKKSIGANALALPGGAIIITDALVEKLEGADDALAGVFAHELGHVRHRHGMQLLVRATLLGAATSVAIGDFSSVLAAAPLLLGHLGYSRDAEREADAEAARALKAAGISPRAMLVLFERLSSGSSRGHSGDDGDVAIAFRSHPMDAERKAFFEASAARGSAD